MNSPLLKYFMVVAQKEHMTNAAIQLNITQPSLSAAIRRLETEIGFELFNRTRRGIQLNDYGKIFLEGVIAADNIMNSCLTEMEELKRSSIDFIRLECSNSPTNSQFIDELLDMGINLKVDYVSNDWEDKLVANNCDFVITVGKSKHNSVEWELLRCQKLALVCGRNHPLVNIHSITTKDLFHYSFCSTDAPHSLINVVKDQYPVYDFTSRITFLGRSSADMIKAICTDKYIGLMVRRNLPNHEDIVVLPVEDFDVSLPIFLYWRKSNNRSASHKFVQKTIINYYQGLQDD